MSNKETFEKVISLLPSSLLYYRDETTALFHGDYFLFCRMIPSGTFKVIPTDPPFGIEYVSGQRKLAKLEKVANDHEFHCNINELWRVTREDGSLWIFYSWKVPFTEIVRTESKDKSGNTVIKFKEIEDTRIKNKIVWDKGAGNDISGMGDLDGDLANVYENIAYMPKPDFKPYWEKRPDNIIRDIRKVGTKRIHSTQKPVKLMDRLIKWSSQPGDLVLEPFAGSGTTAKACAINGRYCIMFELLESNCKKIRNQFLQTELDFRDPEKRFTEVGEEQELEFEESQPIEFYDGTSITGETQGNT